MGGSTHLPAFCQKSEITSPFPCWFDYSDGGDVSFCYLVHTKVYSRGWFPKKSIFSPSSCSKPAPAVFFVNRMKVTFILWTKMGETYLILCSIEEKVIQVWNNMIWVLLNAQIVASSFPHFSILEPVTHIRYHVSWRTSQLSNCNKKAFGRARYTVEFFVEKTDTCINSPYHILPFHICQSLNLFYLCDLNRPCI